MRRLLLLTLALCYTTLAFAQTPLATQKDIFKEAGGKNTTATYGEFHKKLSTFFNGSKALPNVSGLLDQLKPYLQKPLDDQDKLKVEKILNDLENLTEKDAKGQKVSILQTRVALGSFVENLRNNLDGQDAMMDSDTTLSDGTEVMPDTAAHAALDGVPFIVGKSQDSPWVWWIVSGVSILAAIGLGYLYWDEKKKRDHLERQMLNTSSQASQSFVKMQQLEKQVPQLISKIKEYEKALAEYDRALKESQERGENERKRWLQEVQNLQAAMTPPPVHPTPTPPAFTSVPPVSPVPPVVEKQSEEIPPVIEPQQEPLPDEDPTLEETWAEDVRKEPEAFYLSTPNKDGSFRDVRSVQFDPSQSLYHVRITSPYNAEFEFVNDPALVSEALRYPETFLDPVCEYGGGIEFGARNITTIQKGKLVKTDFDSDRWELQHKAIIRFEN
ncbi:hypothetical protein BWI96_03135 [Siphonobacter sp. SORGH_AS_0500]|uniref:hypothetical protein n=1 Tax=Siphonobacter sp. SORGH_AS_0500 TaxID=1864824 RepID=UPI000CC48C05|nr:hypothetical protein [Siphonobacter sp. SORGH_AS_0500]PKK38088.1 hypothetical protein BWI96_03135 [Siphonobacter sp. SORGH_AS_0500]